MQSKLTKMNSINKVLSALLVILVMGTPEESNAARILAVLPVSSTSHFVMGEVLLRGLAARGHQVDVLSHFPLKNPPPNYRDISLAGTIPSSINSFTLDIALQFKSISTKSIFNLLGKNVCSMLSSPQFRNIIENPPTDPPYDVAIVEIFAADCYLALGRHLNIPVVGLVTARLFDWVYQPLGNPHNPAFVPSCFSEFNQQMSFFERTQNFLLSTIMKLEHRKYLPNQLVDVEKNFGIKLSSMLDLFNDVGVVLVNTHPTFDGVRPMTPGIVEVGGLHVVDRDQNMSSEVKKWLDDSTEGCVYFSFGSMVKIESFPLETIKAFYKAFERIAPVRVLIKIAKKDELPAGLPKNVMTLPWLPQTRILQHKNVKAFVTHGGLMSTHEAIVYGVPMITIPIFADQPLNARLAADKKIAVMVDHQKITADSFTQALNDVLKDSTYRDNSKRLAKLFADRPMSALDTAIFWVEYVIRNGNVLRSPSVELSWWQLAMLDVYAFLISIALIAIYIVKRLIKFLYNILFSKSGNQRNARTSKVPSKSKKSE